MFSIEKIFIKHIMATTMILCPLFLFSIGCQDTNEKEVQSDADDDYDDDVGDDDDDEISFHDWYYPDNDGDGYGAGVSEQINIEERTTERYSKIGGKIESFEDDSNYPKWISGGDGEPGWRITDGYAYHGSKSWYVGELEFGSYSYLNYTFIMDQPDMVGFIVSSYTSWNDYLLSYPVEGLERDGAELFSETVDPYYSDWRLVIFYLPAGEYTIKWEWRNLGPSCDGYYCDPITYPGEVWLDHIILHGSRTDCDDADPDVHPGAGENEPLICGPDLDDDGWIDAMWGGSDCDDSDAGKWMSAPWWNQPFNCCTAEDTDCINYWNDQLVENDAGQ